MGFGEEKHRGWATGASKKMAVRDTKRDEDVQLQNNKIRSNSITSKCKTVTRESKWRQLYRTLIIVVNGKKKRFKMEGSTHITLRKKKLFPRLEP